MARSYKPATFQPTVRPDWAGAMSYIPDAEKIAIFEAILKYPAVTKIDSIYWTETIEPDLACQYQSFVNACRLKQIAVRNRWNQGRGIDVYNTCTTGVEDMEKILKDKEKEKENNVIVGNSGEMSTTRTHAREEIPGPSLDEVLQFAKMQTSMDGVGGFFCSAKDAEAFWSHYQSQGWRKSNESSTPVRDWKAQLRFWCTQAKKFNKSKLPDEDDLPL